MARCWLCILWLPGIHGGADLPLVCSSLQSMSPLWVILLSLSREALELVVVKNSRKPFADSA
jgi:hypothetical protein